MVWRDQVDPLLRNYLEKEIQESVKHKKAYGSSENPGLAQLWVAIANLSRSIFDLNLKFNYLERALKEISLRKYPEKKGDKRKSTSLGKSLVEIDKSQIRKIEAEKKSKARKK